MVRGLHSSTFRLDVSTFCVVDLVVSVAKTAHVEARRWRWRWCRLGFHSSTFQLNLSCSCHWNPETTQCVPSKVLTSSQKVDECKSLPVVR